LFDPKSCTYTYLIARRRGGEALLIDPVLDHVDRYLRLLRELDLRLVKAVDTHVHADHLSGLGALRDQARCITVMGEKADVDVVSMRVADGDKMAVDGIVLDVIYTPGHTDDSYSFLVGDRVFTGDTLLIRGTGRTDFQNGCARAQYHSLFGRLLALPDDTMVFPGHDYKGDTVSTIGEEKAFNPRLQVTSVEEYVELMAGLKLAPLAMMDVAVPANKRIGFDQHSLARKGWAMTIDEAMAAAGSPGITFVDLREAAERERRAPLQGSLHIPYPELGAQLRPGGVLHRLARAGDARIVFYCAFGERSAMALLATQKTLATRTFHIHGGLNGRCGPSRSSRAA
jgi:glyoxylase-like metal-dependent hydrolase (beta-lactamase superfamily II)/rhodanese-related sulfurtransferase